MGITVIPNCLLQRKREQVDEGRRTLVEIAQTGKYYRHPDSALISYPLVVQEPLGSINKPLNIAIVGGGAAGIAALYELANLPNSAENIRITLYESDPEHFSHEPKDPSLKARGLKAGRVSLAVTGDQTGSGAIDQAAYEVGAMRFPEIAGLMWHYASILYGSDEQIGVFPNPGTVPTELVHGDRVDRFGSGEWLDTNSPTKKVVEIIRNGLFGQSEGDNTSLFLIGGKDPAKISSQLKNKETSDDQLAQIHRQWKIFANEYDDHTLEFGIKKIIQERLGLLPEIAGLRKDSDKVNYYVELFGTVGFGTGGFKTVYNMALIEMMRLLLWDYSTEYVLPVSPNVYFIKGLYQEARRKNSNVMIELARVCDVGHLEGNSEGDALVVFYEISEDGMEDTEAEPKVRIYDYVILATTPRQTSSMISRIGFNNVPRKVILGDFGRRLLPENYQGQVRPALLLSDKFDPANSKIFTAINHIHMVSSSKVYATIKKTDFDKFAPEFLNQGKIRAIVSDCGLGSSYVVPRIQFGTDGAEESKIDDYFNILISYAWEDDTKKLQYHFGKYPLNNDDTELMLNTVINRTVRYVKDPVDGSFKPWWFGEALSRNNLEGPLSYDWTTFHSSGGFKLDDAGNYYNSDILFRYHTHALKPSLKNKFFLANCSYSHLGGWIEGALMSAVNAVCGLIVAANGGDVNALNTEARKVVQSLDNVVDNEE